MTAPLLRIGHGNGHNKPSLVRFVRAADADSFSCNEAHLLVDQLQRIRGHRLTVPGEDWTDRRAQSTSIVTANKHENLGELTRKVSERIPSVEKFAPDRPVVASFYKHPLATRLGFEGIAHFALHPDATVMKREDDHPVVREYREALVSTRKWMETARRDGLLPFLTGDLQANARFNREWGPRAQIAGPLGMQVRFVHIDCVMFPREVVLAQPLETRELFDHTGFVATFTTPEENR